jgi:predicted GIY-YIG superfamily endonuclease
MLPADHRFPDLIYLGPGVRPHTDLSLLGSLVRPLPPNARAAFRAVRLWGVPGWVYTIHLDHPLGTGVAANRAWHYTGWTDDLVGRHTDHMAGRGARMLAVATERGIGWRVVAVYPGTRKIETGIKQHSAAVRCPVCSTRPSVPRLSVWLAAELERRATQAQQSRRHSPVQRPPGPYTAGVRRGSEWALEMQASGMTTDQIEAAHQAAMAAIPAAERPWQSRHRRGYDASVHSEIKAIRRKDPAKACLT